MKVRSPKLATRVHPPRFSCAGPYALGGGGSGPSSGEMGSAAAADCDSPSFRTRISSAFTIDANAELPQVPATMQHLGVDAVPFAGDFAGEPSCDNECDE